MRNENYFKDKTLAPAKADLTGCLQWQAGNDGDTVIATLPVDDDVRIAIVHEQAAGEVAICALDFLQAQDVRVPA